MGIAGRGGDRCRAEVGLGWRALDLFDLLHLLDLGDRWDRCDRSNKSNRSNRWSAKASLRWLDGGRRGA